MNKPMITLAVCLSASLASAESAIQQFNTLGYGTLSGRVQTLSMERDYDNGVNNHSTTLGLQLNYTSPEQSGWTLGLSYIGAGVLDSMDYGTSPNPGDALVVNGRVNLLNEAYLQYDLADLGLTNSTITAGRQVSNGEVFRADDVRQKKRGFESLVFETRAIQKTQLLLGHAWRESNCWGTESHAAISSWDYQDFGEVFNTGYDTAGVTWGELSNTSIKGLELAVFDAVAYDVANLLGGRAKYRLTDETALLAYYRNETDIGRYMNHQSDAFGLSAEQKVGKVTLEGGYFGVCGDGLLFNEFNTGINHALGSSLMVYAGQYNGGANTVYAKAVTKIDRTKTTLYGLYNYTWHDTDKSTMRSAQELDLIIKQPIPKIDNLAMAFKGGIGTHDNLTSGDTVATDARLFLTYTF